MSNLRAIMFGAPAIYWNDRKINFPFSKMEALLYYLLVVGEATRERLATIFWDEMDDNAAKKNLRNTVYLVKKTISPELFIMPSRTTIGLNPNFIDKTDVELFHNLEISEFLQQCPGEFLEGFYCKNAEAFDEWVLVEREEFKEKITMQLSRSIKKLIHDKDYSKAKQYIKHLIRLDEYNEGAYRVLMQIYEREEDYYRVIEVYDKLENKLASELNVKTSAKTQEIYKQAKEQRMIKNKLVASSTKGHFFGRVNEIQALRTTVDNFCLKRNKRQVILIQGEQGVGKTAIIEHLFGKAPSEDYYVLRTQCYQAESGYAYKAWSSIFTQVMNGLRRDKVAIPPLWYKVMAYIFPALAIDETSVGQESIMMAYEFNPTMIEEVMCGILGKLAKQQRLIIIFDDIHWMDNQSFSVLHQVLRMHGKRVLCAAICHSEYLKQIEKLLWDFERDEMIERFVVKSFSFDDVVKIMEAKLPANRNNAEIQQKLYDYTGGNALFLMECLHLIEAGRELGSGSLRLQSVLQERIGNLSSNARKVLEVASIFFKYSSYHELLAISRIDEFDLVEAIEELEQKKLIVKTNLCGREDLVYTFYNLQIRCFVYQQMSIPRQKLLHKYVGLELERQLSSGLQTQDVYEAILYHYSQANEKIKTLEYMIKIAEKYFCPQYELFPELNDCYPAEYSGFRESRRQIADYLRKIEQMITQMVADKREDKQLLIYQIAFREMMGRYYIWQGEHLLGVKMIHELLRLASMHGRQDYLVKGYQQMIFLGIQVSKPSIINKFAEKLLGLAEQSHLLDKKAAALRFQGIAAALNGNHGLAEQYYRQSITLFKKLDMRNNCYILNIAAAYNYIGNLRRDALQLEQALNYYEQAVRVAGHKRLSEGVAVFYINAGYTAFKLGNYAKAHQYLAEALAVGESFGDYRGYWCSRSYCTLYCVLAIIAVRENRCHEGRMYLSKADEFLDKYHDHYQNGLILYTKTEIRGIMEHNSVVASIFGDYLTLSVLEYYEQARAVFNKIGAMIDLQSLNKLVSKLS